jgi:hypothetical protein
LRDCATGDKGATGRADAVVDAVAVCCLVDSDPRIPSQRFFRGDCDVGDTKAVEVLVVVVELMLALLCVALIYSVLEELEPASLCFVLSLVVLYTLEHLLSSDVRLRRVSFLLTVSFRPK